MKPYIVVESRLEIFLVEVDLINATGRIITEAYAPEDRTRQDFRELAAEHNLSPAIVEELACFSKGDER